MRPVWLRCRAEDPRQITSAVVVTVASRIARRWFSRIGARCSGAEAGEWIAVLTGILAREAKLPRRERQSTQRLFEELRGRGHDGAHHSVRRFTRVWRQERADAAAGLSTAELRTGNAYQFDCSHETITLN